MPSTGLDLEDEFEPIGTVSIVIALVVFWIFQFAVAYEFGDAINAFRVTSAYPSVGWLLSPMSHGWLDHLLVNIIGLSILGTVTERHIKTRYYLVFFVSFSIVSNVLGWMYIARFYSPMPVSGASGSVYAFGAFYAVQAWRAGDIDLDRKPGYFETLTDLRWLGWLTGVAVIIHGIGMSLADISGLLGRTQTVHVAHGVGVILGLILAYSVKDSRLSRYIQP